MRAKTYVRKYLSEMPISYDMSKKDLKDFLRGVADGDEGAENLILEVGISEITHRFLKDGFD
jgi:hypothetical protein